MPRKPYSEELIEKNSDVKYIDVNKIRIYLDSRTRNMEDENFDMYYKNLVLVTTLDHYVCKLIVNGVDKKTNNILKTYLEWISYELRKQPLLFFSLPISRLEHEVLMEYIPNFDDILNSVGIKMMGALALNESIKNGEKLSKEELKTLIDFFYYFVFYDNFEKEFAEEFDVVVKYLLSQEDILGYKESGFLIKYFGYRKCVEENLFNIQILIGDCGKSTTLGVSVSDTITLSKKDIKKTNYSKNQMKKEFSKIEDGGLEGLLILQTLFHELRHSVQDRDMWAHKANDISFERATKEILSRNDPDEYNRNYYFHNIESDANYFGYREVLRIIKEFYPNSNTLECMSRLYLEGYFYKKHINVKKDKSGNKKISGLFVKEQLDKYFITFPTSLINTYPQFLRFYHSDGKPVSLTKLLTLSDVENYENFYFDQIVARAFLDEGPRRDVILGMDIVNKKRFIHNCSKVIEIACRKLKYAQDRLKLEKNNKISPTARISLDVFNANVNAYYKVAKRYVSYTEQVLQMCPELLSVDVIHDINNINSNILKINNNVVVKGLYRGEIKKIDGLGTGVYQNRGGERRYG